MRATVHHLLHSEKFNKLNRIPCGPWMPANTRSPNAGPMQSGCESSACIPVAQYRKVCPYS